MQSLKIVLVLFLIVQVYSSPCTRDESLNITLGINYPNGSIVFEGLEYTSGTWYEIEENNQVSNLGCPCNIRVCLWKCCAVGQMYLNRTCNTTDAAEVNPFNPPVYNLREPTNISAIEHFFMMDQIGCDKYSVDSNSAGEELYVLENGTLYEISHNIPQWHAPNRFCVDMMLDNSAPSPRLVAGVCYPEDNPIDDSTILYVAYGIGLILSVPFLLATFLVYAFIAELRNLHGMCLMAYTGGLVIAYSFLAYLKIHVGKIGVEMTGCYLIAFIVYYAFQSSFFWLNIMCFDIWRTFSGYRGGSSNKRRDIKRFMVYGIYAWGIPAVLTVIAIGMQFGKPAGFVTPGFGSRRCWFVDWLSELVYFFIPVFVLVVCNVTFFSVTANRIRSIKQETAILKGAESSRSDKLNKDKQRYSLYLKLFVVMGVNWTVEVISFAVGGSNWYWLVVDIANIALGFYIFFVFVWKKKVRNLVAKRWRSIRGAPESSSDKWATRSTSAPTEDTRISADDSAIRLKEIH